MRLQSIVESNDRRTPAKVVEYLKSCLVFPEHEFAVLDPCCGDGVALHGLTADTQATTYGVELSSSYVQEARERLFKVARGALDKARISNNAFSLLFLNPPYGRSPFGDTLREKIFLQNTVRYLAPGGVLIYTIPETSFRDDIAGFLSYRFTNVRLFKFPLPEYNALGEIVVMATKKAKYKADPESRIAMMAAIEEGIPRLSPGICKYTVPTSNPEVPIFRSGTLDPDEILGEVRASTAWNRAREATEQQTFEDFITPPIPLHTGHLGLLLASGLMNGLVDEHLVKGNVTKDIVTVQDEGDQVVERDAYKVTIKVLSPTGAIKTLSE